MKKRVLSVLLAAIMLISAVPMVLPAFAAAENDFTEADYNALYVQSGLEMAADFFRNNSYWGGEIAQPPLGPSVNPAYPWDVDGDGTVEAGETIDLTVPANRVTADGSAPSAAFNAARTEWVKAHNSYMNSFVWSTGSMNFLTFTRTEVAHNAFEASPVTMHEGYVQMGKVHNQNGGIGFNNDGAPAGSTATTAQVILGFDPAHKTRVTSKTLLMFHNIRMTFMKNAGQDHYVMNGVDGSSYFGYTYYVGECTVNGTSVSVGADAVGGIYYVTKADAEAAAKALAGKDPTTIGSTKVYTAADGKTYAVKAQKTDLPGASDVKLMQGVVTTMTQTLSRSEAVNEDVLSIYLQTEKVYELASNYTAAEGTWNKCSYIGYGNQEGDLRMYAFRRYSRELSAAEITQNHVADLLKWFKLDIKAYAGLSTTDRAVVNDSLKDFTFESDRDAIAAVLRAECDRIAYDFLLNKLPAGEAYNAAAAFVATAKEFQLSVAEIKLLPETYRKLVYDAVNGYVGIRTDDRIQALIDAKVDEIVDIYYGKYIDDTEYDYRDLYVKQDDLYLAIDFFDAKATDDPVYVGASYDTWNAEYDYLTSLNTNATKNYASMGYASAVEAFKGETLKRYGVALGDVAGARNWIREHRVETKHESNWNAFVEKYLWKGNTKDFEALDISDRNYPHTNVRTFGDGTLICSLNNSVMVHMGANSDNSDVTYQVIGKINGGNWQLRGFRMAFTGATSVVNFQYAGLSVTGTDTAPKFSVTNIGETLTYPSNARPSVPTVHSVDMTVSIDKRPGADSGQYYSYKWNGSKYEVARVPEGTPGAYGPEVFPGLMDASIYMNGQLKDTVKNAPYMSQLSDALGNSGSNTYYAIRIYTCTLSAEEVAQNHFADLAGLYDYDLSLYYRLNEADRASLHRSLLGIELGTEKEVAVAAYEQAFSYNYYYALGAESEAGEAFTALAEEYFLDISSLLSISKVTRERIYTELMADPDILAGSAWLTPILQDRLESIITVTVDEHYAESIVDTLIELRGYQLNLYGDKPGMRGLFEIKENQFALLDSRYMPGEISITLGMMLLPAADAADPITVEDGAIKLPESAIASVVAYENGFTDNVFYMDNAPVYTIEYYPEGDDVNKDVAYVGYICIQIAGEEEPIIGYSYYNGDIARGNAFSLTDFSLYAKENLGMAHKNIQTLTNAAKDEAYVSLIAGAADLSEYTICVTEDNSAAAIELRALVMEYLGVNLKTLDAEKLGDTKHVLYLGDCDTVHEGKDLYGFEARGDNFYLFYNDPANSSAALARFAALLDMAFADGVYQVLVGESHVYHARGLAE